MAGNGAIARIRPGKGEGIAMFSAYYLSHGGGMEVACAELAYGLSDAGIGVDWVAQADGPQPERANLHYSAVSGTDVVYRLSGVPAPLPMPWSLPQIVRSARRARAVIIVEANFALSVIGFVVAKLLRKPILLVQHVGAASAAVALRSSSTLAINTVQVTSEANSSPIITSLTIQSACMNMPPTVRFAGMTGLCASAAEGNTMTAAAPVRRPIHLPFTTTQ